MCTQGIPTRKLGIHPGSEICRNYDVKFRVIKNTLPIELEV